MTYCLAIALKRGLIFVSDSRTNAGADQINTYSKMHPFVDDPSRFIVLLSSGNLATTQGVLTTIRRDIRDNRTPNLYNADDMDRVAEYIGKLSAEEQHKHHVSRADHEFHPSADFILGGQIRGSDPSIVHIYPEGNFVHASDTMPFLQIGEVKYGKPILDRIITHDLPMADALKCALVSMDSTLRSNATVGPPIEFLVYLSGEFKTSTYMSLNENDPYLLELRQVWGANIRSAFDSLPPVPGMIEEVATVQRIPKST